MRPMQPGRHAIKTYGACMSGKVQIGAKIKLIENNPSQLLSTNNFSSLANKRCAGKNYNYGIRITDSFQRPKQRGID